MIGRTWQRWAHRYAGGELHNIGDRRWVELHGISEPIVPVLIEEILGDLYVPEITHYGWQYTVDRQRPEEAPTMIQVRAGTDPQRALMLLDMCFTYGLAPEIERGNGTVVALRITEAAR